MEQTAKEADKMQPGRYIGLLMLACASGVLTSLGLATEGLAIAIVLWPLAAALQARLLVGAKAGEVSKTVAILPIVLTVAATFAAKQTETVRLVAAALIVPLTAVAMAVLQLKKLGGLYTSMGAAAVGIGGMYAMVCLPGILNGSGAFTAIYNLYAQSAAELKEDMASLAGEELRELSDTFSAQVDELVEMVPDVTTGMLFLFGYCGGLIAVLLFFALTAKRREALGLAAPGRLAKWTVPGQIFRPVILFYFLATVLYMLDVANAVSIYYVVSVTFSFLMIINGFATGEWLLERIKRKQGLFRALAYILTAALPWLVMSPLNMLGFVDCVFRIRRRFEERKDTNAQ